MDTVVTVPRVSKSFIGYPFKDFQTRPVFSTHLSFFRFTHNCNSSRASSLKVLSHRNPSNPKNSNFDTDKHNLLINPTWVLFPVLKTIRDFAISRRRRWASGVRRYSDNDSNDDVDDEFNGCYLQSSGIGLALLSVTTNAKHHISPFVAKLAANPTFVSGLLAWFAAQSTKVILNFFVERKWDLRILFASGGMPSSHSALCTALTTSVALCHGVADSLFPVCLGFSLIVMYDAIGVRRHAGMQAEVLNMIIADLFKGHPISERKLKELLGHTPSQVFAGALLGIAVSWFCCQGFLIAT